MADEREARDPAPAVTRSIRLLVLLAEARRPMTLTELATALGLAKSSTANLCLALEDAEMVQRDAGAYRLGRRTAELGGAFAAQFNQVREFYDICAASPVLRDELVQIAMLDGSDALYLARHEGARLARFGAPLGSRLPAALSATGRAMLMGLDHDALMSVVGDAAPFPRLTEHSIRGIPELLVTLEEARARDWARDDEESYPGIVGVAVALEGWRPADPSLALGVAIPREEADRERVERVARALQDARLALTNPFSIPPRPRAGALVE